MSQIGAFTLSMTWLTYRGLDVNGSTCLALVAVVLAPFLAFTILGASKVVLHGSLACMAQLLPV